AFFPREPGRTISLGDATDCLWVYTCQNLWIPNTIAQQDLNDLVDETVLRYRLMYQQDSDYGTYAEIGMGGFLGELIEPMKAYFVGSSAPTSSSSTLKFALYSGHDTTLFPILVAL